VARVAGLLTIAALGVLLVRTFDAEARPRLQRLSLPTATQSQVEEQLPKMAGANLESVPLDARQRDAAQQVINEAFVSGFRLVILGSAVLAVAAAGFGAAIRDRRQTIDS
jgi:hypothetical protein